MPPTGGLGACDVHWSPSEGVPQQRGCGNCRPTRRMQSQCKIDISAVEREKLVKSASFSSTPNGDTHPRRRRAIQGVAYGTMPYRLVAQPA